MINVVVDLNVHRHIGGLESYVKSQWIVAPVHRHIGGLEICFLSAVENQGCVQATCKDRKLGEYESLYIAFNINPTGVA